MRPDTIFALLCVLAVLVFMASPVAGSLMGAALFCLAVWFGTLES